MDYVFGTEGEIEVLKIKGDAHTDLTGYQQTVQEFPGEKITDNFRVVRKLNSAEDGEGNCYDWYEIDRHYREIDRTGPIVQRAAENAVAVENAICELDAGYDERLGAVEVALCELDELLNGGGENG